MDKLSVVIPVYNVYPYLRQCLDSIVNQTYRNLEIIIVNDASPYIDDDEICKEYAEKDERIKYIKHNINKGLGGARNTGIKIATGKYITFVDSDDYILYDFAYEKIIHSMKKSKVDVLLYGVYSFKDGNDKEKKQICRDKYYKRAKKLNLEYFPSDVAWNKIFMLNILKENNLEFIEHIKYEDTEFWYRYVIIVNPTIKYINENYYMYRQREGSIMATYSNYLTRFDVLEMIYDFIKKHKKEKEYRKNIVKWLELPWNFKNLPVEIKTEYKKNAIKFMQKIDLQGEEIFNILDMHFFCEYFVDDYISKKYVEVIDKYKNIKYKYVKINTFLFKINREIKRIFNQMKNFLFHQ